MEPWLSKLEEGDAATAWDLFATRYRSLMLATIRRLVNQREDVMDVFATVCQQLSENDFARLRRYAVRASGGARMSTWLVVVVRNLTVDWLRHRDGRRQVAVPAHLSTLQQQIFTAICIEGHSHIEAYELLRDRAQIELAFPAFLREVMALHRSAPCPGAFRPKLTDTEVPVDAAFEAPVDLAITSDLVRHVRAALAAEAADVRLAVELLVVERVTAPEIARIVGWPNAKAVYNRVYRALAAVRVRLEQQGIGRDDL